MTSFNIYVVSFCLLLYITIIFFFSVRRKKKIESFEENCKNGICCPKTGIIKCNKIYDERIRNFVCESLKIHCKALNDRDAEKEFSNVPVTFL